MVSPAAAAGHRAPVDVASSVYLTPDPFALGGPRLLLAPPEAGRVQSHFRDLVAPLRLCVGGAGGAGRGAWVYRVGIDIEGVGVRKGFGPRLTQQPQVALFFGSTQVCWMWKRTAAPDCQGVLRFCKRATAVGRASLDNAAAPVGIGGGGGPRPLPAPL